jgi:hypothetical protein
MGDTMGDPLWIFNFEFAQVQHDSISLSRGNLRRHYDTVLYVPSSSSNQTMKALHPLAIF